MAHSEPSEYNSLWQQATRAAEDMADDIANGVAYWLNMATLVQHPMLLWYLDPDPPQYPYDMCMEDEARTQQADGHDLAHRAFDNSMINDPYYYEYHRFYDGWLVLPPPRAHVESYIGLRDDG